ncbi:MAG: helix-turn-helix domain-containing protein [Bdellovibrionota bacterium]
MARPQARGDAWVYTIKRDGKTWGILVDEEIKHKTLFEPGSESHDEWDEIIVPLEGRYWVRVGNWARTLTPGEIALIPRDTPHDSGIATNLVGTHFLVLLFDKSLGVLKNVSSGGVVLPSGTTAWLRGAFRFMRQTCSEVSFLSLGNLPDFIHQCAIGQKRLEQDSTHPDPIVTKITNLLEQPSTPSLDDLGKIVGLSPTHLQKRFKTAVGFSPLQYANAWKLDAIASELKNGNTLPLIDIAVEYGFGDLRHFRELFQRRFGASPSAYRKNPPPSD